MELVAPNHTLVQYLVQCSRSQATFQCPPSWHAYERTCEYLLSQGCTQIYTNIRQSRDLKEFKPQIMVGVPRLWESIYEGVQKQFREQPTNKQKLINFLLASSHATFRHAGLCRS